MWEVISELVMPISKLIKMLMAVVELMYDTMITGICTNVYLAQVLAGAGLLPQ